MERTKIALGSLFKRLGTTDEIGKAALFLISDLVSFVTGHILSVDGDWKAAYLIHSHCGQTGRYTVVVRDLMRTPSDCT